MVLVVNLNFEIRLTHTVRKDLGFGLASLLTLFQVAQAQVHVVLVLDSSGVGLVFDFLVGFNVTECYAVESRFHLFNQVLHFRRLRQLSIIRHHSVLIIWMLLLVLAKLESNVPSNKLFLILNLFESNVFIGWFDLAFHHLN